MLSARPRFLGIGSGATPPVVGVGLGVAADTKADHQHDGSGVTTVERFPGLLLLDDEFQASICAPLAVENAAPAGSAQNTLSDTTLPTGTHGWLAVRSISAGYWVE